MNIKVKGWLSYSKEVSYLSSFFILSPLVKNSRGGRGVGNKLLYSGETEITDHCSGTLPRFSLSFKLFLPFSLLLLLLFPSLYFSFFLPSFLLPSVAERINQHFGFKGLLNRTILRSVNRRVSGNSRDESVLDAHRGCN